MEEYGRAATESIYAQWACGTNPAVYLGIKYWK